ncbi:hypothetical protein CAPTEDRAFT_225557 [Capitella teleta]|uniref:Ras-GAP domain-containing protein n=1 Tax=Capitella teleta TaxID=283909 RepID=R7TBB0_CAPTE|nr:hypothetical protein CAPTEDRAFT_225557 [Capitella teleta]|eukprot:ELT88294.1 hypothetical protein CAPTEDRAFT_225557 [Capitella teleta]
MYTSEAFKAFLFHRRNPALYGMEYLSFNGLSRSPLDSAYDKGSTSTLTEQQRRGSMPMVCSQQENQEDPPATPSRLANFFSRKVIKSNLKRTKSVTKLDRKRNGMAYTAEVEGADLVGSLKRTMSLGRLTKKWGSSPKAPPPAHPLSPEERHKLGTLINNRMRASRSHESLLMSPSSMHAIDLSAAELEIKPLHGSILGQDHCFQVSTANGSKYYSCRSAEERQRWIQHLRKALRPTQEQTRRTENSLQIWVLEAKNVPTKKRYFCEVCLDKTLYARTSTKPKGEMLFWGEHFDFCNLPAVDIITVNIYREADKKKKKEKNTLLGYVNIPISAIKGRQLSEKWYTASSATVGKAGRDSKTELPLVRIKARFQMDDILPMDAYTRFMKYLSTDYAALVEVLEPQISVKTKDELASTLVRVLQQMGVAQEFLSDIVMTEVMKLENENLAFRGNSIATKSMEAYMKLIGDKYLQDTLGDFVKTVLESGDDCEVDSMRVQSNATLQRHQTNLIMYCEMAWFKVINSHCFFPLELKEVFRNLCERCRDNKREDTVSATLISACIFLRFLCPAILSPSLFNLTQEFPHEKGARNLTLVAKTIQNLANYTKFGSKEEFMTFMNDFVEREFPAMQTFVNQISSVSTTDQAAEFDGYIDLGRELSVLHTLLLECIDKLSEGGASKLSELKLILAEISDALENRPVLRPKINCAPGSQKNIPASVYDNVCMETNLNNSSQNQVNEEHGKVGVRWSSDSVVQRTNPQNVQSVDNLVVFNLGERQAVEDLGPSVGLSEGQRPDEKQLNISWDKIVSAAELVNGEYVDLINFMDDFKPATASSEADGMSVGQNTVSSSGYQSFGYSQCSSPVETSQAPLSFANPVFGRTATQAAPSPSNSSCSMSSEDSQRRRRQLTSQSVEQLSRAGRPGIYSSESLPHRSPRQWRGAGHHQSQHELSRSVELTRAGSPTLPFKRTVTDTVISLPSEQRRALTSSAPPIRRTFTAHGASPSESSDYESELQHLHQQLSDTQAMLSATQDRLNLEQTQRDRLASNWQQRLTASEERLNLHTRQKDEQMQDIISRLMTVEGELRKEQQELQTVVSEKQQIIEVQEQRIHALDAANNRLLSALNQLKDRCQPGRPPNGLTSPQVAQLSLQSENGHFRSSTC